jgi:hypothetical protein
MDNIKFMNNLKTFIIYNEVNYQDPSYTVKDYFEKVNKSSFIDKYERIVEIKNQRGSINDQRGSINNTANIPIKYHSR